MAQSNVSLPARRDSDDQRPPTRNVPGMFHSASAPQRLRNEESWVEISSQPSSSSLSSIGDEIITTGLRVHRPPHGRRRRRAPSQYQHDVQHPLPAATSSQDEYDETESEEDDRVMTSSTEHIHASALNAHFASPTQAYDADSDDDENATALGRVRDEPRFTPQPNAFSHPPASQLRRPHETYGGRQSHSYRQSHSSRSRSHTPYNAISPSYRAENDAALRASLTTLLSCAAAARGLPKQNQEARPAQASGSQPTGLRLVPESELMAPSPAPEPAVRAPKRPQSPAASDTETSRRKTSRTSTASRAVKKKKVAASTAADALISPTLLTWLVSAGVVVIVSVVGFSAGYAMGKDAGRHEALAGFGAHGLSDSAASCGNDVARSSGGLRRLPWRAGVSKAISA